MSDPRRTYSFRLDSGLVDRVDARARQDEAGQLHRGKRGRDGSIGRTAVVEWLLELYVDGLVGSPVSSKNPFPRDEIELGSSPDLPALVCFSAPDKTQKTE